MYGLELLPTCKVVVLFTYSGQGRWRELPNTASMSYRLFSICTQSCLVSAATSDCIANLGADKPPQQTRKFTTQGTAFRAKKTKKDQKHTTAGVR